MENYCGNESHYFAAELIHTLKITFSLNFSILNISGSVFCFKVKLMRIWINNKSKSNTPSSFGRMVRCFFFYKFKQLPWNGMLDIPFLLIEFISLTRKIFLSVEIKFFNNRARSGSDPLKLSKMISGNLLGMASILYRAHTF